MRSLDTILKIKRKLPKAKRLLESGQYRKLLEVRCPRLLKYEESIDIAHAVTRHIMKKITKRMKDKDIIRLIFKELRKLPLRMLLSRPGQGYSSTKIKWHHVHIMDKYIRFTLRNQLRRKGYNACTCGTALLIRTW